MVNEYIKAYVAFLVFTKDRVTTSRLQEKELLEYRAQGLFQKLTREDIPELQKLLPTEAKRLARILDAIDAEQKDIDNSTLPWL